ncbi:TonB family protein [Vicingus serpentipes]|uniref:TonB family protein n=1 Tax=Vicingus serpentipes TaxID=1926625 RepID=A0A5C6RXZ1_9FLAO|nr:M56 family metallopeptidase [Vicingus serpentipes]TXB66885.1 TonB family protein [Vicingus serpentipes]
MESLFYLLKTGIIYSLFYLFYFLFFRNNTNFQVNRFYLLLSLPLSFIIPIIKTSVTVSSNFQAILPTIELSNISKQSTSFNWSYILIIAYISIASLLFFRLIFSIYKTLKTIKQINKGEITEVLPFSFFGYIHIPTNLPKEDRAAVFHHEQIHSNQLHSLDILIYELSKILLWWNPFIWMGLNSVKCNHEFIADKFASQKSNKYSSILVAQLLGVNCSALANNFNYKPLIKRRIIMMKSKKSNRLSVLKYALVVPVIALTTLAFNNKEVKVMSEKTTKLQHTDKVYEKVDKMPEFEGGQQGLMNYLMKEIKYPEQSKKDNIEGKVFIEFIVGDEGAIKNVKVLKSVNSELDKEATRVISKMPNWTPGEHEGKKVNVKLVLPIMFQL